MLYIFSVKAVGRRRLSWHFNEHEDNLEVSPQLSNLILHKSWKHFEDDYLQIFLNANKFHKKNCQQFLGTSEV